MLADHFLASSGIAAVWIDSNFTVGVLDVVTIKTDGLLIYCCAPSESIFLAHLATLIQPSRRPVFLALEQMAQDAGIGITPHHIVVRRAMDAVRAVNDRIADMQRLGSLGDLNLQYRFAKKASPSLRYMDYLHGRKLAMIETLARERN